MEIINNRMKRYGKILKRKKLKKKKKLKLTYKKSNQNKIYPLRRTAFDHYIDEKDET